MKHVKFTEAVVIAGVRHEPHEPGQEPMAFDNEAADALVDAEIAEPVTVDGLDRLKLDELAEIVAKEGVALTGQTLKADIIAAIRAHRAAI